MEYEKIVEKIGHIRALISQQYAEIRDIKQNALSLAETELQSYYESAKVLKGLIKQIQKA